MKLAPKRADADTAEATASESTPATEATAPETATTEHPSAPFARPRFQSTLTVLAAFAAGAFSFGLIRDDPAPPPTEPANAALEPVTLVPSKSSTQLVELALSAAVEYHATYKTYTGFTAPEVLTASSDDVILLAAAVDGTCAFSKVVDGVAYQIGSDPSGETCAPATLAAAQEVLDANSTVVAQETAVALAASVKAVSQAATLWASLSYDVNGRPSLYGLSDLQVPGSKVLAVASDGQTATVQVIADGSCVLVVVSAQVNPAPPTSKC